MAGGKDGTGAGRILGVMASGGPLAAHSGNSARIAIYPQVHSEPTSPFFESGLSERANGRENQVKKEKNEWIVDTHGLTPVALVAEDYSFLSEGFRTLRLPRKERFHLRADTRSPQRIY